MTASLLVLALLSVSSQQPASLAEDVTAHVQKLLDGKSDTETRLEALRWLFQHGAKADLEATLQALGKTTKDDPDPKLRIVALNSLGALAKNADRSCPVAIAAALFDNVEEVRWTAASVLPAFKTYAPGCSGHFLKAATVGDPFQRSIGLIDLALAAPQDAKALQVIEAAKRDPVFDVRHSAHRAAFLATDELEPMVRYYIRLRQDREGILAPLPADPKRREEERQERNLLVIGSLSAIAELSEKRPDEFAKLLARFLDEREPMLRRGAASMIVVGVVKVDPPKRLDPLSLGQTDSADWYGILNGTDKKPTKEGPLRPSPLVAALARSSIGQRLRRLQADDPDASVRAAAREALEHIRRVSERQPK